MIIDTISSVTRSKFPNDRDEFLKKFEQLYRLEILRPSLNLVVSKCKRGELSFIIEPQKVWDRCQGHCQTKNFFQKIGGIFSRQTIHEINIKTISSDIIMHEMAHAVEKTSGIDLNGDFRTFIGLDMGNRRAKNLEIVNSVENIMVRELKGYKINNIMEELFARYFEMLAMSYEVGGFSRYQFHYGDIVSYFENTTNWVITYFNPLIGKMIDADVEGDSRILLDRLGDYKKVWVDNVKPDKYFYSNDGKKNWSSGTKSTARWAGLGGVIKNDVDNSKIEE